LLDLILAMQTPLPTEDLRVALIQASTIWQDPSANRALYAELIRSIASSGEQPDLIVLPETFLSGFSNDALHQAQDMQGENVQWLRALAAEVGSVICGSLQTKSADPKSGDPMQGGQVFNRLIWAGPNSELAYYDKRHLFRMAGEHLRYGAGTDRLIVTLKNWRICPMVCYDLRFPVFMRNRFAERKAEGRDYDLLIVVANWPSARAHAWRTLLRARAIENLSYCVGVNRTGVDGNQLHYSGDSVILDYTGQALLECGAGPQVIHATLSAAALHEFRERFPAYLDADDFSLAETSLGASS
jgi:omega-amidase